MNSPNIATTEDIADILRQHSQLTSTDTDWNDLAVQCACRSWAMLHHNSFGFDAADQHQNHVAATIRLRILDDLLAARRV